MYLFLTLAFLSCTACGQTAFEPSTTPQSVQGHPVHGVTYLGRDPSVTQAQAALSQGVVVRVTNAVVYPDGADSEPTWCHLSAKLCTPVPLAAPTQTDAAQQTEPEASVDHPPKAVCIPLGIINAATSRTYHVDASALDAALRDEPREVLLELQSSCQVTSLYYPAGPRVRINVDIAQHVQGLDVVVAKAHWAGFKASYQQGAVHSLRGARPCRQSRGWTTTLPPNACNTLVA